MIANAAVVGDLVTMTFSSVARITIVKVFVTTSDNGGVKTRLTSRTDAISPTMVAIRTITEVSLDFRMLVQIPMVPRLGSSSNILHLMGSNHPSKCSSNRHLILDNSPRLQRSLGISPLQIILASRPRLLMAEYLAILHRLLLVRLQAEYLE